MKRTGYVLVNFGGPRNLAEIAPFLEELLTDRDVVRAKLPAFFHNILFKRIARKRAERIREDYISIGGKSPIYEDTEAIAEMLRLKLEGASLVTFHRYLPDTHAASLQKIEGLNVESILVFPLFPQFTYATTGSIARFFAQNLRQQTLLKLRWIKSYPTHPAFINLFCNNIKNFICSRNLAEKDTILLFSAHGLPQEFIDTGDIYQSEVESTFSAIMRHFPELLGRLSYQSKFGRGEWLKPYTDDISKNILTWHQGRKNLIFIPISFTSDHIETLFEVESQYMPLIKKGGLNVYRLSAFNQDPNWVASICTILKETTPVSNRMLIN